MSVISSRKSERSILKSSSSIRSKIASQAPVKVRFVLPHSQNVRNILQDYVKNGNQRDYENLVCLIRDAELTDEDIKSLLKEATACISLLNKDLRLFVEALLLIKWHNRSDSLVAVYQSFLVNLLSAHSYHVKVVIDHLILLFLPTPEEEEWEDGIPSNSDCMKCVNIHSVLNILLRVVPMCRDVLIQALIKEFPYFTKSVHTHEYYLHNLLWIFSYEPSFRSEILHLIVSKLIIMDANAPRDEIEKIYIDFDEDEMFAMDDDSKSANMSLAPENKFKILANSLDVCLNRMFSYLLTECHDFETGELIWDKTKYLYHDMLTIFDELILPTYNCHHVQFCMFLLCSFKLTISEAFLNHLWKKVTNPSVPAVLRQASVGYIASLISRASFVPLVMLKGTLQEMAAWLHSYISTQDGLEYVNSDVRVHYVFYSTCQALFYATTFRHKELVGHKKNISFLENLNLAKIVTCRLNPLRVCQPAVVQNFAAFTRKYQLAYCYSVIEHNSRNVMPVMYQDEKGATLLSHNILDAFYPFDPYVLKKSSEKIHLLYRDYNENIEENGATRNKEEGKEETAEEDDFLDSNECFSSPNKSCDKFSYGTSPGFKFKM